MVDPDFEALRERRNAAVEKMLSDFCQKHDWGADKVSSNFDPNACYCDCAKGGPCEHDWQGWREFEDGCGGEQVCSRCGMGAMSHSLRVAP